MRNVVLEGDVLEKLKEIPSGSIQCCVTSPPYWGLRDYGHRRWFGGDPACEHAPADSTGYLGHRGNKGQVPQTKWPNQQDYPQHADTGPITTCTRCGAWYGQIGLEANPEAYVAHIVEVFQEVRRVLRDDGTLWLNLGDSYAAARAGHTHEPHSFLPSRGENAFGEFRKAKGGGPRDALSIGLKHKDLVGIPWMVAFALRADGWYLRSDIIWHKPNVMPESVQDRPTKCHEYIFLLTKSAKYFYDIDAIREESKTEWNSAVSINAENQAVRQNVGTAQSGGTSPRADLWQTGRNKRSVWQINPKPYKEAHFATFPEELPETCIKAGTSEKGCCSTCGRPWARRTFKKPDDREFKREQADGTSSARKADGTRLTSGTGHRTLHGSVPSFVPAEVLTEEWVPSCSCPPSNPIPCIVLDPFAGSGTTLAVAKYLRRDYIGIELNPEYHKLIEERLRPAEDLEAGRQGFDLMETME